MNLNNAEWYKTGLVTVLNGATKVTGVDTKWLSADVKAGDMFIAANFQAYEIASVPSSTELTLTKPYQGESGSGQEYAIILRAPAVMQAEIANRLAALLGEWDKRDKSFSDALKILTQRTDTLAQQVQEISGETGAGGVVSYAITIPSVGWKKDESDTSGYPWSIDISNKEITADMTPFLTILPASLPVAQVAGLCPTVQTVAGALRVFSRTVPSADIFASLSLLGVASTLSSLPVASKTQRGLVQVGENIDVRDGVISITASGSGGGDDGNGETTADEDIQGILDGSYKN